MDRRKFVKITGSGALGFLANPWRGRGDDIDASQILVPKDKGFSAEWLRSLTERGNPEIYRGGDLKYIGMPVGGICAGQLYLGGDGKLWLWDIFNRSTIEKQASFEGRDFGNRDGATYVSPWLQKSPLAQGFALKYQAGAKSGHRTLDTSGGWAEITFEGKYPMGEIIYADPEVPLKVKLEAFSPFIPLSFDDSSLPATVLRYTVNNLGSVPVDASIGGWLENVVLQVSSPGAPVARQNQLIKDALGQGLLLTGQLSKLQGEVKPDITFADFSTGTYDGWTSIGEAFGSSPVARNDLPPYMHDIGGKGDYIVTSHNFRDGRSIDAADNLTGTLTSHEFTIERNFITFYSSGGNRPQEAGVRLLIDGKSILEATGDNSNQLTLRKWEVTKYLGKSAQIQLFDQAQGSWGNVHANNFAFTDVSAGDLAPDKRHDSGTMALYLMDSGPGVTATACLPDGKPDEVVFKSSDVTSSAERPIAAVQKSFTLKPGESATVTFILSWNFPNIDPAVNGPDVIHYYSTRFSDAGAVVQYVVANFPRLSGDTAKWVETWNDSTLPHWFLNRTFSNTCNLATNTSYRFANGQFWAWEGVYSCEGTCTHVWGYAQAMGRIFPELERALREKTDYAFALHPNDGTIDFRGTHDGFAADGQAGVILRTYREHLMTVDSAFLTPLWPRVKLAMDRLIRQANDKGLLDGDQHNTLDTSWFGEVAWLSGLYLAALRAAEEMAKVCADSNYAQKCRQLFDKGSRSLVPDLFNGEYFINKVDPNHRDSINSGTGCEIDQVMGQSWAWQVGLGRIFPQPETVSALKSLFRYNFDPDAGHYHELMKTGRWYAMPGEAGLLMCTFPKPDWDFKKAAGKGSDWAALYFNECQSGFEHEAASNMIAEGLVQEGLAVTRTIHDRYAPAKRNPFDEIECGDHYSRAMASYGSFITMCGYEYRGPDGYLSFAPRLNPEEFKAAFTTAQGWGSYFQEGNAGAFKAELCVNWGQLSLNTLGLRPINGFRPQKVVAQLNGEVQPASLNPQSDRINISFAVSIMLKRGQSLTINLV